MRSDMAKVIVERPRHGGLPAESDSKRLRNRDGLEGLPTHESMRKRYRERKELSENLSPLYRYLAKQVGRPWAKVYSEIREQISPKNAVQLHIYQHAIRAVELSPFEQDGKFGYFGWRGFTEFRGGTLYVSPKSGLLMAYKGRTKRQKRVDPVDRIALSSTAEYRKFGDFWYLVEYGERDVFDWQLSGYVKRTVQVAKRQLNRKQLAEMRKQYDLREAA